MSHAKERADQPGIHHETFRTRCRKCFVRNAGMTLKELAVSSCRGTERLPPLCPAQT